MRAIPVIFIPADAAIGARLAGYDAGGTESPGDPNRVLR